MTRDAFNISAGLGARALIIALAFVLAGCSSVRTYPNTLEKNLRVYTRADAGTFFSRLRVDIDIFDVAGDCRVEYQGSLRLNRPAVSIGLPVNKPSYVAIVFTRNVLGSLTTFTHETVLTPRPHHQYDTEVKYHDGMYQIILRERGTGGGPGRELPRQALKNC